MTPTKNDTSPRVSRGGSWDFYGPSWVLAASRGTDVPALRHDSIGFRTTLAGKMKR